MLPFFIPPVHDVHGVNNINKLSMVSAEMGTYWVSRKVISL